MHNKSFWIMLGCLAFAHVQAASFDCAKAQSATEKMICSDAELSRLDEAMAQAYRKALQDSEARQAVIHSQQAWLKKVSTSCSDEGCLKRAYQTRIAELGFPSNFRGQRAQITPRAASRNLPGVCQARVEAINRGELEKYAVQTPDGGLLLDINGDGQKERVITSVYGTYRMFKIVLMSATEGEPERIEGVSDYDSTDERLIKFGDRYYIEFWGEYETPQYIAKLDNNNEINVVCKFEELKPIANILSSHNDALCKLGQEHGLDYVRFDGKPISLPFNLMDEDLKLVAAAYLGDGGLLADVISPNEATADIDNDGKPDRLVKVFVYRDVYPLCTGHRLAVLNQADDNLDRAITPLLPEFDCTIEQAPFKFGGQTYIDDGDVIFQLKNGKLNTICEFRLQRQFVAVKN